MYKFLISLLFLSGTFALGAQEWHHQIDKVKELAKQENKHILLVFQGSDWCAPCMKLERDVWESEEFKIFATENLVLLKADFPRKKKNALSKEQITHNEQLAEQYNTQGYFPLVLVLNDDGKVLGSTAYKKLSTEDYIQLLTSFIQ
ncbi:thioredoxin family protein [Carboxylicivirga sp. N1Y90]|uniref:thioredoxin family protein n=1 Tax=Carboxylicivirga fragile TaxID=3417571 RepID=UPI003D350B8F|nr:thioredoxin family protein [Marinilabiliaceae bacterium N1Y90]